MSVFQSKAFDGHEQIDFINDAESGLRAVIAVHSTRLGPALGGCRYWRYADEADAVDDVLRLSRGMTFKAALAGLPYGGGKSVILADPARPKDAGLMRAFGRAVDRFGGRYVAAEDVGTSPEDMAAARAVTPYVAGLAARGGDPSEATAFGVWRGIRAAVRRALRRESLDGVRVLVQGVGHVGWRLCGLLKADGARLTVSDLRAEVAMQAAAEFDAEIAAPAAVPDAGVEVYAPCALGAVLNDETIPRLKAAVVAGSANNQLAEERHGAALARRGILFAPDYVVNAGGLINVHHEISGNYRRDRAFADVARIEATLEAIFDCADRDDVPPHMAADRIAADRIAGKRLAA